MSPRAERRAADPRRVTALSALALALVAQGYGCREIAVAPEVVELYGAMCTAFADCGLADAEPVTCPQDLYTRIGRVDELDYERAALLAVTENACLEGCAGLRRCLAENPFCLALGQPCQDASACCGSDAGVPACVNGACCVVDGGVCGADQPCCSGEACDENGRCGGKLCTLKGKPCVSDYECCSLSCRDGACEVQSCSLFGEPCLLDDDCCDEDGVTSMRCDGGVCGALGCAACDPNDPDNCCIPQGLVCYQTVLGTTSCGDIGCAIDGLECGDDSDCACPGGGALVCDDAFAPHCATCRGLGSSCPADGSCCEGLTCDSSHRCAGATP